MKIRQTSPACLTFSFSSPQEKRKKVEISICANAQEAKTFKIKSDILILTNGGKDEYDFKSSQDTFLIDGPGEYEVSGIFVHGLAREAEDKRSIYAIASDNLTVCYLEGRGWQELKPEQSEKIGAVDGLVVSVQKEGGFSGKELRDAISEIEPKLVVLAIRLGQGKKSSKIDDFLKEMRVKSFETLEEVEFERENLKEEGRRIVVLDTKNQ